MISGIIPAAGRATRLGKLPFSKELFPVDIDENSIIVVSDHLIKSMAIAGIDQLHIVIRDGKWDIPSYYGSKIDDTLAVCYHIAEVGFGVPFTVNQAFPFVQDQNILLGFPDILFKPVNAYQKLLEELNKGEASIVLGVFPISKPEKWDMVEVDANHTIQKIIIKPKDGQYKYGWVIAAWKPVFSSFLNTFVEKALKTYSPESLTDNELHFGNVIIKAMEKGMQVKAVVFEDGKCLDTGTPDEMKSAGEFNYH